MDGKKLEAINLKIMLMNIADTPGAIMFGLGIYGKFGADGQAFWPMLNDERIVNGLLVCGAAIMAFCGFKIVSLIRERARILKAVE